MLKRLAYYIVYRDLIKCPLYRGIYDAKNGSQTFMHGVALVMEFITCRVSEKTYEDYSNMWLENVIKSEEKANV